MMNKDFDVSPEQEKYTDEKACPLSLYKDLIVGKEKSYFNLFSYEFLEFVANLTPSVFGVGARMFLYKLFLNSVGKRPYIGKDVKIRTPSKIIFKDNVLLEDDVLIDARGEESFISLGNSVLVGRNSFLIAKNAKITLEDGVNISSFCRIATQSKITIKKSTLISAYCYIGPGNHKISLISNESRISKGMDIKGGVTIGENCWIGTRSTILDGVTIGNNSIVGAHSFVKDNVPENSVVAGCPAKVISLRN